MLSVVAIDKTPIPLKPGGSWAWIKTSGFEPALVAWEVPRSIAAKFKKEKMGKEVTLRLHNAEIKRAILVANQATPDPLTEYLIFADVRWYLVFRLVLAELNDKWPTGSTRFTDTGTTGGRATPGLTIAPNFAYRPWTLYPGNVHDTSGQPWTWRLLAVDKLAQAAQVTTGPGVHTGKTSSGGGSGTPTQVAPIKIVMDAAAFAVPGVDSVLPHQYIDDVQTTALAKAISGLPGRSVYVDDDGALHLYDALLGSEDTFVRTKLPRPRKWHGSFVYRDLSAYRAGTIIGLCNKLVEVRSDVVADGQTVDSEAPWSEMVFPCPVPTLAVKEKDGSTQTVAEGSWLTLAQLLAARSPIAGSGIAPLTEDIIRDHFFSPVLEDWYIKMQFGGKSAPKDSGGAILKQQWMSICDAIRSYWRLTFRFNPRFWGRCLPPDDEPTRAAVFDPTTGTRGKAPVYMDHFTPYIGSSPIAADADMGVNAISWDPSSSKCEKAPFEATWRDAAQGIWTVRPDGSVFSRGVLRSPLVVPTPGPSSPTIATPAVPTLDPYKAAAQGLGISPVNLIDVSAAPAGKGTPSTTSAAYWNCAIILALRPAAPNGVARLHPVAVDAKTALTKIFGATIAARTATGYKAPDKQLRIGYSARFPWNADNDTAVSNGYYPENYKHFGLGISGVGPDKDTPWYPTVDPINQTDELIPIVEASAAAYMADLLYHWEGTFSFPMHYPGIKPKDFVPLGSIRTVGYRVTRGERQIVLGAGNARANVDPIPLMPAPVRKLFNREV